MMNDSRDIIKAALAITNKNTIKDAVGVIERFNKLGLTIQPLGFKVDNKKPYEAVDHPKHYNEHPANIECIDVIEHMVSNIASAVKYLWRAGLKPNNATIQDLDKAIWYITREKQRLVKLENKKIESRT